MTFMENSFEFSLPGAGLSLSELIRNSYKKIEFCVPDKRTAQFEISQNILEKISEPRTAYTLGKSLQSRKLRNF